MSAGAGASEISAGAAARERERPDRRHQSRYAVEGRAGLVLVKSGTRMAARILDLSLSGCQLRTEQPFIPGIFVRVEVEFQLCGNSFRLSGVSQSIHDRNTVGIRFLDVSSRWMERLLEVIAEVDAQKQRGQP